MATGRALSLRVGVVRARRPRLRRPAPAAALAQRRRRGRRPRPLGGAVNNVVIADRSGDVRYRLAGRVPLRDEANRRGIVDAATPAAGWTGWLEDAPRSSVAADGEIVTANERRGPRERRRSAPPSPRRTGPTGSARCWPVATTSTSTTSRPSTATRLHVTAGALQGLLAACGARPGRAEVHRPCSTFDGRMDADSTGAAASRPGATRSSDGSPPSPSSPHCASRSSRGRLRCRRWTSPAGSAWRCPSAGGRGHAVRYRSGGGWPAAALEDAAGIRRPGGRPTCCARRTPSTAPVATGAGAALRRLRTATDCVRCTASLPGHHRRVLPRLGGPLRLGPRRPSGQWLGGAAGCRGRSRRPAPPRPADAWVAGTLSPVVTDWDRLALERSATPNEPQARRPGARRIWGE